MRTPSEKGKEEIRVDFSTMLSLRVLEFDKMIAEQESRLYELKKDRAAFLYEKGMERVINQKNKQ